MAARASGKQSKSASKANKARQKTSAKKSSAKKSTTKKSAKKASAKSSKKATKKKAAAPRKSTTAKSASKARPVKAPAKPTPAGTGVLVHTRLQGIAKRLLGPSTTSDGVSASGGISHTNPARSVMLRRLLG